MNFKVLIFLILSLFFSKLNAQTFKKTDANKWKYSMTDYSSDAFLIKESDFPDGQDHTTALQRLLDSYKVLILPNKLLNINYKGLFIRSDSEIYFQKNTVLKMIPNSKERYSLLNIEKVKNITIYNPQLIGDRNEHKAKKGEWGMGVNIRSSQNIKIYNSNIINMWGDGIYLGIGGGSKVVNKNINIIGGLIDFCRRNGVSITSGNDIVVKDLFISNIYGVSPMEGIDIEPNTNSISLTNITLDNIKTSNVGFAGIAVALDNLRHLKNTNTKIDILNHIDEFSPYGFRVGYVKDANGTVNVLNSKWLFNTKGPVYFSNIFLSSVIVNLQNNYMQENKKVTASVAKYYLDKNRSKEIRLKNFNFK